MSEPNFKSDPVNIDYLINSGLLFLINQQCLHPVGIGLVVKIDPETKQKQFAFKDCREEPEKLVFDDKSFDGGMTKYQQFTSTFAFPQIQRRQEKLGWGCQYGVWDGKKYQSKENKP